MFWKRKKETSIYHSLDVKHKRFLDEIDLQLKDKEKEINKRISQFTGISCVSRCRVVDFYQMKRILISLLNEALVCVDSPYQMENIESILLICHELFKLWGIGYQILSKVEEESLERIVDIIDTLKEEAYESPFE